ncbi:MAG: tetratricopeptide repeat protein, partial [Microscillaceae bacterium]|nr:tetratricopeptide repeat protein [Microscillaceae bacterium]
LSLFTIAQEEGGPNEWLHKLDEHYAFFNKNRSTPEAWQKLKALEQDFQLYTGAHRAFLETEMLFHRARFISRQFPYLAPGEDEALLDTAFQRLNALDTTQLPDTLRIRYAWLEASLLGEKAIFFQYELEDLKQADKLWRAAQLAFKRLPMSPKVKRGLYVVYVNWLNVKFFLLDLEEGIQIGQEALQMAQLEKETAFEAYLAHNLGNIFKEQNQIKEAEALYNRARTLYEALGDTLHLGALLNNLAILLDRQFREGEAYLLYLKALEMIGEAQAGNVRSRINVLCCLGTLTNQSEDTWGYLEEAEQLALRFNLPNFWLWDIYEKQIFHANVRKREGLWVAAIKKAEELYPRLDWANHPGLHADYFEARGDYFQHRGELGAALEAYHKGLNLLKPLSHFHLKRQIILHNKIAQILLQQEQYEEALAQYDQNLANNPLSQAQIEDMPEEALVYFKAYFADMEGRMGVCQALAQKMPQQALFWLGQAEEGALRLDSLLVKAESPDFFRLTDGCGAITASDAPNNNWAFMKHI